MCKSSRISIALVAYFAVTDFSDFLTFSSGPTTGSAEVLGETSLQSIVNAPSSVFTFFEFHTLVAPGATPGNTISFTVAFNYPKTQF